jgi:hypothetical protein
MPAKFMARSFIIPEIEDLELIKQVLESPDKIKDYELDKSTNYYYKYLKNIKSSACRNSHGIWSRG